MQRLPLVFLLAFAGTSAQAAPPEQLSGTYSALTAHEPDEFSTLTLAHQDGNTYALSLKIVAPNRTHHTGDVEGVATLAGGVLTLTKENFVAKGVPDIPPTTCVLRLRVDGRLATVLSDEGCAFYHGAGASFVEQGGALIRQAAEPASAPK